jgi:hypothetical protein
VDYTFGIVQSIKYRIYRKLPSKSLWNTTVGWQAVDARKISLIIGRTNGLTPFSGVNHLPFILTAIPAFMGSPPNKKANGIKKAKPKMP